MLPAPRDGGFQDPDYWIWCGSAIRGEDGRYHLFASRWPRKYPFYWGYCFYSEIVRAVSDRPEGPFRFVEVVFPDRGAGFWDGRMTHNPTIHRVGDTYLLFYIGTTFEGEKPSVAMLENYEPGSIASKPQAIGLATAPSMAGPWRRADAPILALREDEWDHSVVTNPAPCILPDGRIFLYYRSYGARIGLAVAESFSGPWKRFDQPVINADGEGPIEDMFVWWEGDRFHMISKDLTKDGRLCGQRHGGVYASSTDGMKWTFEHKIAYSRLVRWDDGSTVLQGSLERPQLLFENGYPRCLYAATGDGPGGFNHCTRTWNVAIPLGTFRDGLPDGEGAKLSEEHKVSIVANQNLCLR